MEKDQFENHNPDDYIRLKAGLVKLDAEKERIKDAVIEDTPKMERILESTIAWSYWYQFSLPDVVALFLVITRLDIYFNEKRRQGVLHKAVYEFMANPLENVADIDGYLDDEMSLIVSLTFAVLGNITSTSIHSLPMKTLLDKARDDDEAMFNAIMADRTVLSTPIVTKRIQIASLIYEESFFVKLSKAITRTRPRRPEKEYDHLRYIIEALDQSEKLSSFTFEQLYKLFVTDLKLYPKDDKFTHEELLDKRKDIFMGLKRLIKRRNKAIGT